ncbi:MAG: cadmium-translocating P-type ATPase [Planctomycetaceae bacterium]|nr:cadmium-translocating P-type ATPase [Planctomycetaceae bacterium]
MQFRIDGMDCAEEVTILRREIGPLVDGEENLSFDILNARMIVRIKDDSSPTEKDIVEAVARTGMKASPLGKPGKAQATGDATEIDVDAVRRRIQLLTAASGIGIVFGFALHASLGGGIWAALGESDGTTLVAIPLATKVLYGLAIFAGVWTFVPKAIASARRLRPDMNLLMVVAVTGAVYLGDWLEAAMVAFLFTLSLALESWSIGRARRAVAALLDLTPPTVTVLEADKSEKKVPAEQIKVGTKFVVRAGERIPLDGKVVTGASAVNQAPLTGESVPVSKAVGDDVFAGTVNGEGTLEVESTKAADQTAVANIIRLVGEAQANRAPSEQWVDAFARYYTPIVMVLAVAIYAVGGLATGDFPGWLYRALVLLVIACPCALVISTPVSIVAALAGATRRGILIKGGPYVEAPARLRAIAFDKTGTLTVGKPTVQAVVALQDHDERQLLQRAAAMEAGSNHPLAVAILEYAKEKNVEIRRADDLKSIAGKGATGIYDGRPFWIGSHRYLEERGQETPEVHEQIVKLSAAGRSVVVVGNEKHVCGFLVLADAVRPSAIKTMKSLRTAGIEHLIMLSGDNEPTAKVIAAQVGIDEVRAELMPSDKVTAIEELVKKYGNVAMIGDGINDSPALARANLGIAMGGIGSDAAIETADVALMGDDISQIPWLIAHSRRALRIIQQNIIFSLVVKAVFVVLTVMGHASLWAAIAADTGASLLVIFNGLRLLKDRDAAK